MGVEIERKFLPCSNGWRKAMPDAGVGFKQGYLSTDKERTVRVRIAGPQAFLTVKGMPVGLVRPEFEYEVPREDAVEMLMLCEDLIEKTRYKVEHAGHTFEVDEFHGAHEGLVLIEVEMASEDEEVLLPDWVGDEVTDNPRYLNSMLVQMYLAAPPEP